MSEPLLFDHDSELDARFNIRGRPWIATAEQTKLRWGCGKPGANFRCAWCGHRFAAGERVRCVYTNSVGDDTKGICGNPFICQTCDGPREEILAKLRGMRAEFNTRFWWFGDRHA
jgi:hypothetical protein